MKIKIKELETIILEELTALLKEQDNFSTFERQIQGIIKAIQANQAAIKQLTNTVEKLNKK